MEKIRKIDVHAHVSLHAEYEFPKVFNVSVSDQLALWDALNVEKGVLLPIASIEGEITVIPNGDNCYLSRAYPDRFYWFCNVDPRAWHNSPDTDLGELMRFYKANGAKGIGEVTANLYMDDPMVENMFRYAAELDLPVTIHIAPEKGGYYGLVDDIGLPRLDRMLSKYPKLKVLGHSQPFWAEISRDVTEENRNSYPEGKVLEGALPKLLRKHQNLYCDLSAGSGMNALMRDPEYGYRFIEEFRDRLMYGIDLCLPSNPHPPVFASFLDESHEKGFISDENYYRICRGNAIRILGLSDLKE